MGCFSFICKECGEPILSNSFRGQKVKLSLLEKGVVADEMSGEYNSYGCVFDEDLKGSKDWKIPWNDVCELMFDGDKGSGIAAVHDKCYSGEVPETRSDDDPNQGWGKDGEYFNNSDDYAEIK